MNKTKRKIFETAMQLFADKGYEATSIEEITATVGVAKGTLYYHFSSKEERFNFLVEEGMKLLKNSIQIKTDKVSNYIDKIRAIILIQIKVIVKYESLITIVLSQMWGKEERNKRSRKYVFEYLSIVEDIVREGIEKGEIIDKNPEVIASEIFSLTSSCLIYKLKLEEKIDIQLMYKEIEKIAISGIAKQYYNNITTLLQKRNK